MLPTVCTSVNSPGLYVLASQSMRALLPLPCDTSCAIYSQLGQRAPSVWRVPKLCGVPAACSRDNGRSLQRRCKVKRVRCHAQRAAGK